MVSTNWGEEPGGREKDGRNTFCIPFSTFWILCMPTHHLSQNETNFLNCLKMQHLLAKTQNSCIWQNWEQNIDRGPKRADSDSKSLSGRFKELGHKAPGREWCDIYGSLHVTLKRQLYLFMHSFFFNIIYTIFNIYHFSI